MYIDYIFLLINYLNTLYSDLEPSEAKKNKELFNKRCVEQYIVNKITSNMLDNPSYDPLDYVKENINDYNYEINKTTRNKLKENYIIFIEVLSVMRKYLEEIML